MNTFFTIQDLVRRAHYGYVDLPFPEFVFRKNDETTIDAMSIGKSSALTDVLGRPLFMDFKVSFGTEEFYLPNEPLITINAQNMIVKTVVLGKERKGTVKEYINADDYAILIEGICINMDNQDEYPTEQVDNLRKLQEYRGSINIQNDLLRLFGIYSMVIENVDYAPMMGISGAQTYSIRALSDSDFYADLSDKAKQRKKVLF